MNDPYPHSDRLTIEEWRVIEAARNWVGATSDPPTRLPRERAEETLRKNVANLPEGWGRSLDSEGEQHKATVMLDVQEAVRWIRANAGYFGVIGDDPETMANAFWGHFDPSSELRQCSACGGWFPDPFENHHTADECQSQQPMVDQHDSKGSST